MRQWASLAIDVITFKCERNCVVIHRREAYKCGIKLNDQLIMIKLSSPLDLVKVAKYNEMKKYHVPQISSNFLGCISIILKIQFCPYYSPCEHGVQYILCLSKLYYRQLKCIISF